MEVEQGRYRGKLPQQNLNYIPGPGFGAGKRANHPPESWHLTTKAVAKDFPF